MADYIALYRNNLPNPDIVDQELPLWKNKWSSTSAQTRSSILAESVKNSDEKRFPNVFVLLKIGCTLPVTSCECEKSFSAMRRLWNLLRWSMKTDRLTSLGLMNLYRDIAVDYDQVAKLFFQSQENQSKNNNSKSYIHYVIRIALVTPSLSTPIETAWLTGGNAKFLKLFRSESY